MNAPLPFVSLVVVNYNGMAHLPDCLRSVAGLDYPSDHLQILLIDNGSTDGGTGWGRGRERRVGGMGLACREERAYRRPGDYDTAHYLLFASGGAMAIRREAFFEVGGFDPDYFMYHEDVDLGWRLWLQGYKILYVPSAVVHHRQGGGYAGDSAPVYFLNERNALFTVIKNCGDAWLARLLPLLLFWVVERTGGYLRIDPAAYGLCEGTPLPHAVPVSPAALFELPREAFVQMMLRADVGFAQAAKLLDSFSLGTGDTSLFSRHLRRLHDALGAEVPNAGSLVECFLYLADHTVAEVEARFGPDLLSEMTAHVGIDLRDVQLLARTLTVAGSRLLAGLLPETAAASERLASSQGTVGAGLLALLREAAWRDAVFYREELAKRTDQLIRVLQEDQQRQASSAGREAAWIKEEEALRAELATKASALEETRSKLAELRR